MAKHWLHTTQVQPDFTNKIAIPLKGQSQENNVYFCIFRQTHTSTTHTFPQLTSPNTSPTPSTNNHSEHARQGQPGPVPGWPLAVWNHKSSTFTPPLTSPRHHHILPGTSFTTWKSSSDHPTWNQLHNLDPISYLTTII